MSLRVEGLTVAVGGRTVIDGVDLEVAPGEVLGLAGESGAGKSTLARAVLGQLDERFERRGIVRVDGQELWRTGSEARRDLLGSTVSLVPPDPVGALHPAHRIGRLLAEPLVVRAGMSRSTARAQALELLGAVGLSEEVADRLPHELSGGMCQRVLVARSISLRPRVLVADEPVSALDREARNALLDLMVARVAGEGGSLLLIGHDTGELAARSRRVLELRGGALLEQDVGGPALPAPRSRPAAGEGLLQVRDLVVERGRRPVRRVLDGVSLDVAAGEAVALTGPSGVGKSTLLRAVCGLVPISAGTVVVMGNDLASTGSAELRRLRPSVRLIPQEPAGAFDPRWTVRRSVREPLDIGRSGTREGRESAVDEALDRVGLERRFGDRRPAELSSGQRQRAAIARALVTRPRVVLADEPTSALDAGNRQRVLNLLGGLRDDGVAVVVSSHDRHVVGQLADREVELSDERSR